MKIESPRWLREKDSGPIRIEHLADRILWQGRSPYQEILLAENARLGKYLLLDGDMQSCTGDAPFYHELLVHPGLLAHPQPRRVLVLGGGEGATLKEVLRHRCVQEVVMVERDPTVVKVCRDFAPEYHGGAFQDSRCRLIVGDAYHYLQEAQGYFDVIVGDLTAEPHGLDFKELYRLISSRLGLDGLYCAQLGSGNLHEEDRFLRHFRMLRKHWSVLCPMVQFVPSYHSLWCFLTASHGPDPARLTGPEVDQRLIERTITSLHAYDGEAHRRACHLPKHLRRALEHVREGTG
ncbi:MAG: spermidine synthase [Candidatus Eremiobacteraeota bacterium]|nr:spermidine synthase [Candidatus Eremiobacteraeota bacterium]MCW5870576.1 spermidine synthase [Candidatus Eremiobacteraeota bacterium]